MLPIVVAWVVGIKESAGKWARLELDRMVSVNSLAGIIHMIKVKLKNHPPMSIATSLSSACPLNLAVGLTAAQH